MISSELYDKLKLAAIIIGVVAGFLTGVGQLINNEIFTTAGAIIMLADSALLKFLEQSSKQFWEDKDIVQKQTTVE